MMAHERADTNHEAWLAGDTGLLDGGKVGVAAAMLKPWKSVLTTGKTRNLMDNHVYMFYDEASLRARRGLARGANSPVHVETMRALTGASLRLPEVPFEVFLWTNTGDAMGVAPCSR